MVNEKVQTGVFLTTGPYTAEAIEFAKGNRCRQTLVMSGAS